MSINSGGELPQVQELIVAGGAENLVASRLHPKQQANV
jgi:hypothetical protein